LTEKFWQQWRHKVESGGIIYETVTLLVDELRNSYQQDDKTRIFFDSMAWNEELIASGIGDFESTMVKIPVRDIRLTSQKSERCCPR
jgi:hypothetical protein